MPIQFKIDPKTKDITFYTDTPFTDEEREQWRYNLDEDPGMASFERMFLTEWFGFDIIEPEENIDLTNGLIFSNGKYEWWDSNYAIRCFLEDLLEDGEVTIQYARPSTRTKAILLRQWPRYFVGKDEAAPGDRWRKPYCAIFLDTNEIYALTSTQYEWTDQSGDQVNDFKIQSVIEHSKPVRPSDKEYHELIEQIEYMWRDDHPHTEFYLKVYSSREAWQRVQTK